MSSGLLLDTRCQYRPNPSDHADNNNTLMLKCTDRPFANKGHIHQFSDIGSQPTVSFGWMLLIYSFQFKSSL